MKKCAKCQKEKSLLAFSKSKAGRAKDGHQAWCKQCARENHAAYILANPNKKARYAEKYKKWASENRERVSATHRRTQLKKYKLTQEGYDAMLARQGGVCKICGATEPGYGKKHLVVDHDHRCCPGEKTCGKCVRGLLCYSCNTGVGDFRDNIGFLIRAAEYVKTGGNLPSIVH